jgi:hypothetical protein
VTASELLFPAAGALLSGWLTRRVGRRWSLAIGIGLMCIGGGRAPARGRAPTRTRAGAPVRAAAGDAEETGLAGGGRTRGPALAGRAPAQGPPRTRRPARAPPLPPPAAARSPGVAATPLALPAPLPATPGLLVSGVTSDFAVYMVGSDVYTAGSVMVTQARARRRRGGAARCGVRARVCGARKGIVYATVPPSPPNQPPNQPLTPLPQPPHPPKAMLIEVLEVLPTPARGRLASLGGVAATVGFALAALVVMCIKARPGSGARGLALCLSPGV